MGLSSQDVGESMLQCGCCIDKPSLLDGKVSVSRIGRGRQSTDCVCRLKHPAGSSVAIENFGFRSNPSVSTALTKFSGTETGWETSACADMNRLHPARLGPFTMGICRGVINFFRVFYVIYSSQTPTSKGSKLMKSR